MDLSFGLLWSLIPGSYAKSIFSFVRSHASSKVSMPFCIPGSEWEFLLLCILISIWCCHSNRGLVVFHSCFNLPFPDDLWFWAYFHMLNCHCVSSLLGYLLRSLAHCSIGYCWVLRVLFLGLTVLFSRSVFCKYFLWVVCLLVLLILSFAELKFLILILMLNLTIYQFFLSWIVPFLLYLKSDSHT